MQLALVSLGRVGQRISQAFYLAFTEEVAEPTVRPVRMSKATPKTPPRRLSMLDRDHPEDAESSLVDWAEVSRLAVGYLVLRGIPRAQAQRIAEKVAKDSALQGEVRRRAGTNADEMALASTLAEAA